MTNAVSLAQQASTGVSQGFKNRIINGAMVIDQRNAGASVTPSTNGTYTLDRWVTYFTQNSKFSVQQNAGSVTPPPGFTNYLGITVGASANVSLGASDEFEVVQPIEGFNSADFDFGKSTAKTITLSFWIRSSLTGSFSVTLYNNAVDWCYPASYTINSANTWEYKTITIPGQTSGTWLTTNGIGIQVLFSLGAGSNRLGTANTWVNANRIGFSGQTNLITTNSATLYITGVQLEVGSTATSFDYRPYGTEFDLCCRYYYKNVAFSTYSPIGVGRAWSGTNGNAPFYLPVPMRGNQTITYSALTDFDIVTVGNPSSIGNDGSSMNAIKIGWYKASGVTSGNLYQIEYGNTTSAWLAFSAEL